MQLKGKGYPRVMWMLFCAAITYATGMAFLWPLTTIYVHDVLGKSLTVAGIVLVFNQGGFLVGSLVGGLLLDRWGKRPTLLLGAALACLAAAGMGMQADLLLYATLLTITGFCSGIVYPGMNALAIYYWPEGGRKGINLVYVATNVGVALGSALGGLIASLSFQWTFFGNAAIQLIVLLLFTVLMSGKRKPVGHSNRMSAQTQPTEQQALRMSMAVGQEKSLLSIIVVCLGLLILWIVYVQWQSNLSAYMQAFGITLTDYSKLWTLNGTLILCGQPLISWVIRRFARTLAAQILLGSYVFVLSVIILLQATTFTGFFVAMFVITLGEMLVWPGVPAIAAGLAPPGRDGWYQGIVAGASSAGRMIGPLLGAILVESLSARWMLVVMMVCCLLSVACFTFYQRFRMVKRVSQVQTIHGD